jgi:serine/threonine-protein kinase
VDRIHSREWRPARRCIATRDADAPDLPGRPSPAAENILKERISHSDSAWSEDGARSAEAGPISSSRGSEHQAAFHAAAGLGVVVTKYALNAWTIKCIDRATGEEIYYNTTLPAGEGSWASEEKR